MLAFRVLLKLGIDFFMLKFILISLLLIFVVARFFAYILRIARLFAGKKTEKPPHFSHYRRQKEDSLHIIRIPQKKSKLSQFFRGGDYIDFQEIDEKK